MDGCDGWMDEIPAKTAEPTHQPTNRRRSHTEGISRYLSVSSSFALSSRSTHNTPHRQPHRICDLLHLPEQCNHHHQQRHSSSSSTTTSTRRLAFLLDSLAESRALGGRPAISCSRNSVAPTNLRSNSTRAARTRRSRGCCSGSRPSKQPATRAHNANNASTSNANASPRWSSRSCTNADSRPTISPLDRASRFDLTLIVCRPLCHLLERILPPHQHHQQHRAQ